MSSDPTAPGRVLVIQHVAQEGPGAIAGALRHRALETRVVYAHEGQPIPETPDGYAGVVVMGGPMDVRDADRLPHLADEIRLLRAATRRRVPILGVCLGSQLLAAALGAEIRAAPRPEIGFFPVTLRPQAASDPVFSGAETPFPALHWHGDVFALPEGAVSLAYSQTTEHQAFRFGDRAYGLLFHLEIDHLALGDMLEAFGGEVREAGLEPAQLLAAAERHLPALRRAGGHIFDRWAALAAAFLDPA